MGVIMGRVTISVKDEVCKSVDVPVMVLMGVLLSWKVVEIGIDIETGVMTWMEVDGGTDVLVC